MIKPLEKALNPDPNLIAKFRKALFAYAAEIGLYPSIYITKQEFIENNATFAEKELARVERGEKSILVNSKEAAFDLVTKTDDGTITREESLALILANGKPESVNDLMFEHLDTNKTGKLLKKDIADLSFRSWCTLGNPDEQALIEVAIKKM